MMQIIHCNSTTYVANIALHLCGGSEVNDLKKVVPYCLSKGASCQALTSLRSLRNVNILSKIATEKKIEKTGKLANIYNIKLIQLKNSKVASNKQTYYFVFYQNVLLIWCTS